MWSVRVDPGICGLGGGDAPMVPRRLSGGGFAHADCDCGTTPLGTFGSCVAGGGRRGRRRCLAGRPRAVSGLAELSAVLDGALPTRNSLAERVFNGFATSNACHRIGVRAMAVDLAGPLPGQHDRRSGPSRAEYRAAFGGNAW